MNRRAGFVHELHTVFAGSGRRLPLLAALVFTSTALDLVGVALVAPLLALAIGQRDLMPHAFDGLRDVSVATLGTCVVAVYIARASIAIAVQHRISAITERERARLMERVLAAFQAMPWDQHLLRSGADLVNRVLWYTHAACSGVLCGLLRLAADGLVFIALAVLLVASDPRAATLLAIVLGGTGAMVYLGLRSGVSRALRSTADANARVVETTQQALGAFREIRLLGHEDAFRGRLAAAGDALARASARHAAFAQLPRHALELALVAFVVALLWVAHRGPGAESTLPLLATFAAAGMRLLPAANSMVSNANAVRGHRFALSALADELRAAAPVPVRPSPAAQPGNGPGFRELSLSRVSYTYPGAAAPSLTGIDLVIRRGEAVGLMGPSGAGKSTLADLVLGLLTPSSGALRVDGVDVAADPAGWQRNCAYIPQAVYLLDDTLLRNIVLADRQPEPGCTRLRDAIDAAQLRSLVDALPDGLGTVVGERGSRLSGGQRQRVAIARALYHQRDFLVLDEATSALDAETEAAVVAAIAALAGKVTMLIIAHRESTLAACGRVLRLEGGTLRAETIRGVSA